MHDFSIAKQIASRVIELAEKEKASQVLEVKIKIGRLTHLNPEQVEFWLRELFRDTVAEKTRIKIEKTLPFFLCKKCKKRGKIKEEDFYPYYFPFLDKITCPYCGSTNIEIKEGRECVLERIKVKI